MNIPPSISNETSHASEMDPNVAAVMAVYGDPLGDYTDFLAFRESNYTAQPYWFWYQSLDSLADSPSPPASTPSSSSTSLRPDGAFPNACWTFVFSIAFASAISIFGIS